MEYEISFLSWDSRYFWSGALKIDVFVISLLVPYITLFSTFFYTSHLSEKWMLRRCFQMRAVYKVGKVENPIQRQFITINCILIAILLFCSQPVVWFWMAVEFWLPKPLTPKLYIVNLMIDNILYLKFMLDPFVYAWRLPKYQEALLKICPVMNKCKRKQKYEKRIEESVFSQSRETVMTLEIRKIDSECTL